MASIINASSSGSGGIVQTADASGVLQLQSNGTVALTVGTNAYIGIGTTPSYPLDVYKSSAGSWAHFSSPNTVEGSEMWLGTDTTDNPNTCYVAINNSTGASALYFRFGGSSSLYNGLGMSSSGAISVGGVAPVFSGSGVTFPATQNPSSDANTLDDYEEGTWTPSIGGNATYGTQRDGWYVKVGQLVTIGFDVSINTLGTGANNAISGLPFTSISPAPNVGGAISYFASLASNVYSVATQLSGTSFTFITTTSAQATCNNVAGILGNGSRVIGQISYRTST